MENIKNPFEYDAATSLSVDQVLDFYIEDFSYSRFIESTRNIFLVGERGSGKTMTLLFNSYRLKSEWRNENKIAIYIPCKTPLFYKKEYELIQDDQFKAAVISEHFFVLAIAYHLVVTLQEIELSIDEVLNKNLITNLEYVIGEELIRDRPFLESIKCYIEKENVNSQRALNQADNEHFYQNTHTFYTLVIPLIQYLKRIPILKRCHFLLLIDDAHDLNSHQIRSLNSWIAYRQHSDFSFKVATAKIKRPEFITSTGGSIIEGHDFLSIDMEEPFQSRFSDFGKLARKIINKRLLNIGLEKNADDFFPLNKSMEKDLEKCAEVVRREAEEKYPKGEKKKINDWIYKYKRAEYFRSRAAQANLPPYSGFEAIVHLSTGVIRNLLYPCYWMFDKAISESEGKTIDYIESSIQNDIIKEKSEELWFRIDKQLYNIVDDCSTVQAEQIKNLFENLAMLFQKRLKSKISEPRAISFSISAFDTPYKEKLEPLLRIAQEAQLLYSRIGSAKDNRKREIYYTPNRMLWPIYGLDPVGQHARVSLKAIDIWAAANGQRLPFVDEAVSTYKGLFNEHGE